MFLFTIYLISSEMEVQGIVNFPSISPTRFSMTKKEDTDWIFLYS